MRRIVGIAALAGLAAAAAWWLTPPAVSDFNPAVPQPVADPDAWIAERDTIADERFGLVAGTEQRIRWQTPGERTPFVVVHLHGFSASRQETAPLADTIADALGANLYEARLTGHGHASEPMAGASAEAWIMDAAQALSIGNALGNSLIVLSTSTGGTLSLAMIGHPLMENVDTLAMISPNLMPADPAARWLTRPAGPLIAKLMVGETRSWSAHNELQERFWTTSYPTEAVVEVMRLVDRARSRLSATIDHDVIMFVSPGDRVISPDAARAAFDALDAPRKRWIEVETAEDPSSHVLAGDILSPGTTRRIAAQIVSFVRQETVSERREP